MYKDRFVVAVKVGGSILREKNGVVYLPFGSEYSLLLKNLESRKSSIKISIDGQDVMNGHSILLAPNSSIDLERFVESMDRGNRFKFIQKTKEIVDHRGDRVDDGIVRVEFAFEQVTKHVNVIEHMDHCHHHHHHHDYYPYRPYWPYSPYWVWTSTLGDIPHITYSSCETKGMSSGNVTCFVNQSSPLPDEGITVRGSESRQCFHEGYIGVLDPSEVIIIRLRGEGSVGVNVEKPLTVNERVKCSSCGRALLFGANFCEKCGTAIGIR